MPSLLNLIDQEGQSATNLQDDSLRQMGSLKIRNIEAKSENRSAAYNLGGRVVGAAIQTADDYKKTGQGKGPGQDPSNPASVKPNGSDLGGDFLSNLINPYSKYENLRRVLSGNSPSGQPNAPDNRPFPSSDLGGGTLASAQTQTEPQQGQVTPLHQENAPMAGYVVNSLLNLNQGDQ